MRLILNLVWLVLSGFWLALGYVLAGALACILIITIPSAWPRFALRLSRSGRSVVGSTVGPLLEAAR